MQQIDSVYTIYIVGSMASGKSTLINAIIGEKFMPYASNVLVSIEHADINNFQGFAYDQNKMEIMSSDHLTRQAVREWNEDESVSFINIVGRIPFVKSLGVKIKIVEVSLSSKNHCYEVLKDSGKSLILFVTRGDSFFVDDDFLHYVCMNEGGKWPSERFLFLINRMDVFNPEEESVESALANIKASLEKRGIFNPNIFPVSAQAALEARTKPIIEQVLPVYKQYIKYFPSTHFDAYYEFSHLPDYIRMEIEHELFLSHNNPDSLEGDYSTIEIHSGIVSLEKALSLRIMNVSFNNN